MVLVVVAVAQLALMATASYLAAHHSGPLAPAIAATHGYTLAFAVSAALLGLGAILFGAILAVVLLPSRPRLTELRNTAAVRAPQPGGPAVPASRSAAHR